MQKASGLWQSYLNVLHRYPWRAWSLQTATIMGLGDVLSQMLADERKLTDIDKTRALRFAAMGLLYVGPAVRGWYIFLDRLIGINGRPTTALKKMLLDQGFFAPLFLGNFMILMGLIQRQPFSAVEKKLREDYMDVLKANWTIWPAVQMANFYFVPLQHRIIVVNFTALCWNTYLAWKLNKK